MTAILLLIICMLASAIGAVVGAGGGVIIKPVLDMFVIRINCRLKILKI